MAKEKLDKDGTTSFTITLGDMVVRWIDEGAAKEHRSRKGQVEHLLAQEFIAEQDRIRHSIIPKLMNK